MRRQGSKRANHLLIALAFSGCGGGSRAALGDSATCRGGKAWHVDDAKRFRGCEHVEGDLALGGALTSLDDFQSLVGVSGSVTIGPSYQLNNLSGLGNLESVGGDLNLEQNWRASGVFLGALRRVGGHLTIRHNSTLVTVALHKLEAFGALRIEGNSQLERVDLSGLPAEGPAGVILGPSLESVLAPARIDRAPKAPTETPAKGS